MYIPVKGEVSIVPIATGSAGFAARLELTAHRLVILIKPGIMMVYIRYDSDVRSIAMGAVPIIGSSQP